MAKYVFIIVYQCLIFIFTSFVINKLLTPKECIHHPRFISFCFQIVVFLAILALTGFSLIFIPYIILATLLLTCAVLFLNKVLHKLFIFFVTYFLFLFCEGGTVSIMLLINLLFSKAGLVTYFIIENGDIKTYIVFPFLIIAQYYLVYKFVIPVFRDCLALMDVRIALQLALPICVTSLLANVFASYLGNLQLYILLTPICLLIYIGSFVLFIRGLQNLQKLNDRQLQLELEEKQLESLLTHSKLLEKEYEDFRRWNHDISNHLLSISYLAEKGDFISADNYIGNILEHKEKQQ